MEAEAGGPQPARAAGGRDGRGGRPPRLRARRPCASWSAWRASRRAPSTSTSRSKQDCFLATFDDIVLEVERRVDEAFDRPGDLREKLLAGVATLITVVAEEQAAASLVTVESLTLGAAAVPHRERASARFEELIRRGFDESPVAAPVDRR